jgi:hypothetical protein
LIISLYILPALAVILKIRKRKLAQASTTNLMESLSVSDTQNLKLTISTINASTSLESSYVSDLNDSVQKYDSFINPKFSSNLGKHFCCNSFTFKALEQMQVGTIISD